VSGNRTASPITIHDLIIANYRLANRGHLVEILAGAQLYSLNFSANAILTDQNRRHFFTDLKGGNPL
jgi:hypothetical protein